MKRCVNVLPSLNSGEEYATCFNAANCVTPETEIIIVGTITPPKGTGNGYFYTAPRNKIYGYIDEVRRTNLKELKLGLGSSATVQDIITVLQYQKIAFLDVMRSVVRKQGSPADADIRAFCLDVDTFKSIFKSKNNIQKVICNSRLAVECYKKIQEMVPVLPDCLYIPQRSRVPHKQKWLAELK